jgi:TRAP-type C4-dicarboxylate transport system substrate-binding protein
LPPEQRRQLRERWRNMSPAERQQFRQKMQRREQRMRNMTPQQRQQYQKKMQQRPRPQTKAKNAPIDRHARRVYLLRGT